MSRVIGFLLLVFIFSFTTSCEVDDICTQEVLTPKLILTFYDATNREVRKDVDTLTVWAVDKENLYTKEKKDSIAIPLNLNADVVKYFFNSSSVIDTFTIHYDRKEVFLSRSCGYKINYTLKNETQFSENWVNDFEINTQTIENEQAVHVKIFH